MASQDTVELREYVYDWDHPDEDGNPAIWHLGSVNMATGKVEVYVATEVDQTSGQRNYWFQFPFDDPAVPTRCIGVPAMATRVTRVTVDGPTIIPRREWIHSVTSHPSISRQSHEPVRVRQEISARLERAYPHLNDGEDLLW